MIFLIIIAVLFLGVLVWGMITYNGFVRMRNEADEALSDIDVQLKRRFDLIPNLVETVKGYATHESQTFQRVTEARAQAMEAPKASADPKAAAAAQGLLGGALMNLLAVAENYPELKANQNFLELQSELTATEDKIAAARRYYNRVVRSFNTELQQFPTNLVGKMAGFKDYEFYEVDEESEREAPQVKFS